MAEFPKLKTGAVTQYPSTRERIMAAEAVRFLDSSEQRYLDSASARRRWVIDLRLLDATEFAAVRELFVEMRGSAGRFDFEDPWSGALVPDCRFGEDELVVAAEEERDLRTVVTVLEP